MQRQLAADQAGQLDATEARRPEYLKRTKRPLTDVDLDEFDDMDPSLELGGSNAGVTDSPVKGRRIALFQETSEESFEQSLLAGGYARYGDLPAYTDPQTPQNNKGKGVMSQRAMDWLQHPTPDRSSASTQQQVNGTDDQHHSEQLGWVPSEREMRKRRRLAAFDQQSSSTRAPSTKGKLVAVEIEGKGRVLMDKLLDEQRPTSPVADASPVTGRRRGTVTAGARKKKGRTVAMSPVKRGAGKGADENELEGEDALRPNWLDTEFPWSTRARERNEWTQREHAEKMKWIERFLDRDSDDSEEEDQALEIPVLDDEAEDRTHEEIPYPSSQPRPGRGKMVPLTANPDAHPQDPPEKVLIPSDPADARAVLWSKRRVRALAYRRRHEPDSDDDMVLDQDQVVRCICNGQGEGYVVQCDDCGVWYHFACIGIRDGSELGRREDLWFCKNCLDSEILEEEPSSEPTFVPTDDQPSHRKQRDPFMYSGSGPSPAVPWSSSTSFSIPKTPVRGRDPRQLSSSSSWDASSSSRAGPTTPSSSGLGRTSHLSPAIFDASGTMPVTPTRSTRLHEPFTTPKMTTASAYWGNRPFQTPSRPAKRSGGPLPFQFDDSAGPTPHRTALAYAYDDTPIRRSKPVMGERDEVLALPSSSRTLPRHMLDSPLGSKSRVLHHPLGMPESPTAGRSSSSGRRARGGAGRGFPKTP